MIIAQRTFAHQGVGNRQTHVVDKLSQLLAGLRQKDAATNISDRAFCVGQRFDNVARGVVVDGRLFQRSGVLRHPIKGVGRDHLAENIHRHVDQHRPGLTAFGQDERPFPGFRPSGRRGPRATRV